VGKSGLDWLQQGVFPVLTHKRLAWIPPGVAEESEALVATIAWVSATEEDWVLPTEAEPML
jgi:hypothetical protein